MRYRRVNNFKEMDSINALINKLYKQNMNDIYMSKEELLNNVRNWITIDNEIRTLQKEQKIRKEKKKHITDNLITFMKSNEVDCFEVKDGNLSYVKRNVKKPINKNDHSRVIYPKNYNRMFLISMEK